MTPKRYDDKYLEVLGEFFSKIKQKSFEWLALSSTDTIADVGCGTGKDALLLSKKVAKVYGIDHDKAMLSIAQQSDLTNCISFICSEAKHIPIEDEHLDKIRYDRIFQHLPDYEAVLKEAYRLLKPNGLIQILDIDYLSLTFFMENEELERKIIDRLAYYRFPNSYKVRKLPTILSKIGFEISKKHIENITISDFEFANYAINFKEMLTEGFEKGAFAADEYNQWQSHIKQAHFSMNLNFIVLMGRKLNSNFA